VNCLELNSNILSIPKRPIGGDGWRRRLAELKVLLLQKLSEIRGGTPGGLMNSE
jgi:hypothetical protein